MSETVSTRQDGQLTEPWAALETELRRWADLGQTPTLWWRDDDAVQVTPALHRLLDLSETYAIPVHLAVIPAHAAPADEGLADLLASQVPHVLVWQHGWSHDNHALAGHKAAELSANRAGDEVVSELRDGMAIMRRRFASNFQPVLVPPWNRIGDNHLDRLAALGFQGLSKYKPRKAPRVAGLDLVNCHVDLIDWKARAFAGEARVLKRFCWHLELRRTGEADSEEPTGLLTHHLAHDEACWAFLATFFERLASSGAVEWVTAMPWCAGGAGDAEAVDV